MTLTEFSDQFDVLYNNITSNQAPGLTEYEKSLFLTKAQDEIIKNYFTANSKGNNLGQGFDDSAKRQADFSVLMKTMNGGPGEVYLNGEEDKIYYTYTIKGQNGQETTIESHMTVVQLDARSRLFAFPVDTFIIINEALLVPTTTGMKYLQVIPLRYDEYTRLMSKPYKRPLKNQAWRLINSGTVDGNHYIKCVEIITIPEYDNILGLNYRIRYIRRPKPIIVGSLDDLQINGYIYNKDTGTNKAPDHCELDPILHEDILQRAVELAKIAWTQTGQDNAQLVLQAGQRSE